MSSAGVAVIFHIVRQRGIIDGAQPVLPQIDIGGNGRAALERNAVSGVNVVVQRNTGMVPDAFTVDAWPMGENRSLPRTKGIAVVAIRLPHIRTAKESGVGYKTRGRIVVGHPSVAMQIGIIHLLGISLAAAGERERFAFLFALGGVADVLGGRGN